MVKINLTSLNQYYSLITFVVYLNNIQRIYNNMQSCDSNICNHDDDDDDHKTEEPHIKVY